MTLQELPVELLSRNEYLATRFRIAGHYPHILALADRAFRWGAKQDSKDLMVYVLKHGAPVDVNAVLCSAEVKRNPEAIELLAAKRAAIDPLHSFTDPLRTACFYSQLGPVITLLDRVPSKKKALRSKDHRGRTALHRAVGGRGEEQDGERHELVYMLLDLGADPTERDMNGQTALTLAEMWRRDEMITTLKATIKRKLESPPTPEVRFLDDETMESPADTTQFSLTDDEASSPKHEISAVDETFGVLAENLKPEPRSPPSLIDFFECNAPSPVAPSTPRDPRETRLLFGTHGTDFVNT